MPKALVVFGSESGTAEKAIKELAAQWKAAGNWTVVDVIDGNPAAKQGLEDELEDLDLALAERVADAHERRSTSQHPS